MPRPRPTPAEDDFGRVLDGARRRDPACLRGLHDLVVRPVVAYLRANGAVDASGSANEVLFRALTKLEQFEGAEDRFRAWVMTIAHHLLVDERRARSRRPQEVSLGEELVLDASNGDPAVTVEQTASTRAVLDAVAGLPELQRQVVTLRWVGGLSLAEVADVLGSNVGAIKAVQHRGVENLRRQLGGVTQDIDRSLARA